PRAERVAPARQRGRQQDAREGSHSLPDRGHGRFPRVGAGQHPPGVIGTTGVPGLIPLPDPTGTLDPSCPRSAAGRPGGPVVRFVPPAVPGGGRRGARSPPARTPAAATPGP